MQTFSFDDFNKTCEKVKQCLLQLIQSPQKYDQSALYQLLVKLIILKDLWISKSVSSHIAEITSHISITPLGSKRSSNHTKLIALGLSCIMRIKNSLSLLHMRTSHTLGYTSHIDGMSIRHEVDLQSNGNQHFNRLQVTLRSKRSHL